MPSPLALSITLAIAGSYGSGRLKLFRRTQCAAFEPAKSRVNISAGLESETCTKPPIVVNRSD